MTSCRPCQGVHTPPHVDRKSPWGKGSAQRSSGISVHAITRSATIKVIRGQQEPLVGGGDLSTCAVQPNETASWGFNGTAGVEGRGEGAQQCRPADGCGRRWPRPPLYLCSRVPARRPCMNHPPRGPRFKVRHKIATSRQTCQCCIRVITQQDCQCRQGGVNGKHLAQIRPRAFWLLMLSASSLFRNNLQKPRISAKFYTGIIGRWLPGGSRRFRRVMDTCNPPPSPPLPVKTALLSRSRET